MEKHRKVVIWVLACILALLIAGLAVIKTGVLIPFLAHGENVYFLVSVERGESKTQPAPRPTKRFQTLENRIPELMQALIAGPTDEEKSAGFFTNVPPDARLLNCRIEGDVAFLDFSPEIEEGGGITMMQERLAQIVFTATQFPAISKVRIMIDGKFIPYFSSEGITDVDHPIGREDFAQFSGGVS